jgi:hypothetical protein
VKRKYILWVALWFLALLAFAVLLVPRAIHSFFYPAAPRMPAVVSKPVAELLTELEALMKTNAPLVLEQLQPGLSTHEISALEQQNNIQLPEELRALYRLA